MGVYCYTNGRRGVRGSLTEWRGTTYSNTHLLRDDSKPTLGFGVAVIAIEARNVMCEPQAETGDSSRFCLLACWHSTASDLCRRKSRIL